jgi:hypothetical protein
MAMIALYIFFGITLLVLVVLLFLDLLEKEDEIG